MKNVSLILLLCFAKISNAQNTFYTHKIDSIKLREVHFTKAVVYHYMSVEFVVEFDKFKKVIIDNIESYNEIKHPGIGRRWGGSTRGIRKSIRKLQSVSKKLDKQTVISDTVFVPQIKLDDGRRPQWMINWFITKEIDSANCMIRNQKKMWQFLIIRDTGPWWGNMRGGRKYYFPGEESSFIEIMDWER